MAEEQTLMPNKKKDMVMFKNKSSSFFSTRAMADGVTTSGGLFRENKNRTIKVKMKRSSELMPKWKIMIGWGQVHKRGGAKLVRK